jgi:hypothetical protein
MSTPIDHQAQGMRVTIEDADGTVSPTPCFLLDCFPEAEEYADALAELERAGVYSCGGGAAPLFRLRVVP